MSSAFKCNKKHIKSIISCTLTNCIMSYQLLHTVKKLFIPLLNSMHHCDWVVKLQCSAIGKKGKAKILLTSQIWRLFYRREVFFQNSPGTPRSPCKKHWVLWRVQDVETMGLHLIDQIPFPAVISYSRIWAQTWLRQKNASHQTASNSSWSTDLLRTQAPFPREQLPIHSLARFNLT